MLRHKLMYQGFQHYLGNSKKGMENFLYFSTLLWPSYVTHHYKLESKVIFFLFSFFFRIGMSGLSFCFYICTYSCTVFFFCLLVFFFPLNVFNSRFSHDVTTAMLVPLNKEKVAMLVPRPNPQGIELYYYANASFCFR